MRHALAVFLFSLSALGCSFFPPVHKVPLSFSVHVKNDLGSVVGLKLRVTRFRDDEFLKLTDEQQRIAKPEQFVDVIAESITDASGMARFNLRTPGNFTLAPDHPASGLNWVGLDVVADAAATDIELQWPAPAILKARQLSGRLSDGLMSSSGSPLKYTALSVRSLVPYTEVATATTGDDGAFHFDNLPSGLYFLHIGVSTTKGTDTNSHQPRGDIAVYVDEGNLRRMLSIAMIYSSCGLAYDLEENKSRYKPQACFKGGKPVACKY